MRKQARLETPRFGGARSTVPMACNPKPHPLLNPSLCPARIRYESTAHLWVFITGGCSGRGVQWMGVVLYSKLVYITPHESLHPVSTAPHVDESRTSTGTPWWRAGY